MSTDQTTPPLDLPALTEIAKAVALTEWTVAYGGIGMSVYSNWDNEHGDYATRIADGLSSEEAHHIAAFDPPTVLALIARATAAEAAIARVRELREGQVCSNCRDEYLDALDTHTPETETTP